MRTVRKNVTNNTKQIIPVALLKFGQKEHLNDLLKNGILYLSSVEDLRTVEKNQNKVNDYRNDSMEGAHIYTSIGRGTASTMLPNGEPFSFNFINLQYHESYEIIDGNICSFYGITMESFVKKQLIPVDKRMIQFGSHFLFIKDFQEFICRLDKALEKLETSWYYGFVEYFNEEEYDGEIHMFQKRSRYNYQNEFRIYLRTENTNCMKLEIGNIEDIARIGPSDSIDSLKMTIK